MGLPSSILRQAALLLKEWFLSDSPDEPVKDTSPGSSQKKSQPARQAGNKEPVKKEKNVERFSAGDDKESINPPLTFQLKSLDPDHPFFEERGISPKTVRHFNLGFCSKGIMRGRIAIPIYNHERNLVAYCGRAVFDQNGRYINA